ncbi:MAG: hypothetical protein V3R25_10285 [Nitrosomonadaceae bacterium]
MPTFPENDPYHRQSVLVKWDDGTVVSLTLSEGVTVPECRVCGFMADHLCDYPIGDEKTCDAGLCYEHINEVMEGIHYCEPHFKEYQKYDQTPAARGVRPPQNDNWYESNE